LTIFVLLVVEGAVVVLGAFAFLLVLAAVATAVVVLIEVDISPSL
jgi:hypothetical protein